jgi:hypothetical protein
LNVTTWEGGRKDYVAVKSCDNCLFNDQPAIGAIVIMVAPDDCEWGDNHED